jgi:hypothetical protein
VSEGDVRPGAFAASLVRIARVILRRLAPAAVRAHHVGEVVLAMPSIRSFARHAVPMLLEGVLGPFAVFYGVLSLAGYRGAIVAALAWSAAAMVRRLKRREPVSGLLVFGLAALLVRTAVAYVTGSALLYFLQPAAGTGIVALAFLASALAKRPLAQRLAQDFCPLDPLLVARAGVRRFFIHISFLWSVVLLANAGAVALLLFTSSLRAFVLERAAVTWGLLVLGVAVSVWWFVRAMRGEGITVTWGARRAPAEVPAD